MLQEEELTGKIIGLAMKAHRELGPGFKESIYHQTMIVLLSQMPYWIETEKQFEVFIDTVKVGIFRADLVVEKKIIVEIKAISGKMPKIFQSQVVSYLKASHLKVGLLLNFGNPSLEFQRLVY